VLCDLDRLHYARICFDESQGIQGQQIAPAKEECACKTVFLEAYVYGLEAQEEDSRKQCRASIDD